MCKFWSQYTRLSKAGPRDLGGQHLVHPNAVLVRLLLLESFEFRSFRTSATKNHLQPELNGWGVIMIREIIANWGRMISIDEDLETAMEVKKVKFNLMMFHR